MREKVPEDMKYENYVNSFLNNLLSSVSSFYPSKVINWYSWYRTYAAFHHPLNASDLGSIPYESRD
jgi:hypothetical protein